MFDYGDVIAYILLVLHRKPGQEGDEDNIDPESFEIKDIVRRALQGRKVPVGMASGKHLVYNLWYLCLCTNPSFTNRLITKKPFLFYFARSNFIISC
jgi:hypothetical protein